MGGELGGPWGEAPRFRPRRTRGVRGRSPPIYKCTAAQRGPGACPRFGRLVKGKFVAKVRMGGEPPGLGHNVQGRSGGLAPRFKPPRTRGGPGGLPPGLGHSAWN